MTLVQKLTNLITLLTQVLSLTGQVEAALTNLNTFLDAA